MLVLSRKFGESIVLQGPMEATITVTVVEIHGGRVRLGFQADSRIDIQREELLHRLHASKQDSNPCQPKAFSAS